MKTKAIIFDKDGTLMDFESFWVTVSRYAITDILRALEIHNAPVDEVLCCLDVKDGVVDINGILAQDPFPVMGQAIHDCLKKYGCTKTPEEMTEMTISAYHGNVDKGIVIPGCDDIVGVMTKLKEIGIRLAVVTTDDPYDTKKCLQKLKIDSFFNEVYTDDGILPPKPDPYCIDIFCKKYSLSKDEVIMVGDTLNDVRFARNGGIRVIGVAKNENNRNILEANADCVLRDISYIFDVLD